MTKAGSEEELCFQLARYMQLKHPDVPYHFDYGSGTKLTKGQAIKQKRLNKRAWPDLFIAAAGYRPAIYSGLFIELKTEKHRLKNGGIAQTDHVREQYETLAALRMQGYAADFACGFDEAVKLIEDYLR